MQAIVRKELADYFSSLRFFVLFILTIGVSPIKPVMSLATFNWCSKSVSITVVNILRW